MDSTTIFFGTLIVWITIAHQIEKQSKIGRWFQKRLMSFFWTLFVIAATVYFLEQTIIDNELCSKDDLERFGGSGDPRSPGFFVIVHCCNLFMLTFILFAKSPDPTWPE